MGPRSPLKVLVVDDHADTTTLLQIILQRHGHQAAIAASAAEALAAVRQSAFDLVISDIGLPDLSGLELMRKIREHCNTPGIALSGYGMERDRRASFEAGFSEHLLKPIELDKLVEALQRICDNPTHL